MREERGKVGFVIIGKDTNELSIFYAYESIYFHAESSVNRFNG